MSIQRIASRAKEVSQQLLSFSETQRNQALNAIADQVEKKSQAIMKANKLDIQEAIKAGLKESLIDRLLLNEERIEGLVKTARAIASQEQVVGVLNEYGTHPSGMKLAKQQIPLGVIAMIFESRPNVVIDCSCLAIKSGNAILLKGGKEAKHSNEVLTQIVRDAIAPHLPKDCVQLITTREETNELLKLKNEVDVVIPRGGESLIHHVYNNASMPVIAHFRGLCHIYVHLDAKQETIGPILLNAKVQRPGVCNAMESLLIHKDLPSSLIESALRKLSDEGVEIRGCERTQKIFSQAKPASNEDYNTEYLDKILSVKLVDNHDQAIAHIQKYGSGHTESILTEDQKIADEFVAKIDASCLMVNASTRFNDGGELGLGAELGISTTKIHAYGPMGAREMTTSRFVVQGQGQIRN
jgi:glutamate-5-semialdehyde dehydrogenase